MLFTQAIPLGARRPWSSCVSRSGIFPGEGFASSQLYQGPAQVIHSGALVPRGLVLNVHSTGVGDSSFFCVRGEGTATQLFDF